MTRENALRLEAIGYIGLVLAALLACGGKSKEEGLPSPPSTGAAAGTTNAPAAEKKRFDVNIIAPDLSKEYHANEVAADQKYKGKLLAVTGKVIAIEKDVLDNMVVRLQGDGQDLLGISATMREDQASKVAGLSKGQIASLICTGGGMIVGSPVLNDCEVARTDKDPKPAPAASAGKR